MLLAIDTSTNQTGIACYDASGLLGECAWLSGREHTTQLLPQIDLLLHHLGCTPEDLQVVTVALGPGSWSGLRVGLSVAKGLAIARNIPLIGIGTLDALVHQFHHPSIPVVPLVRLGRDRLATARFAEREPWQRLGEDRNVTVAELCSELRGRTFFCGDIDAATRDALQRSLGGEALFPTPTEALRRPGYLAELGWQRFNAGSTDHLATLEPIYLGQPVKTVV